MKQLLLFIFTLTLFPVLVSATKPDLSTPALAPVREYLAKNNLKITQKPEDAIISGYVLVLGVGKALTGRGAHKPLLIKAKGISQGTDIVLADTDAQIAFHNNITTSVFTSIRVAVIIKP
jgi:hypothetical protein